MCSQMADSEDVMRGFLAGLPAEAEKPEIIGIVVNEQGMERAMATPGVTTLGISVFDLGLFSPRQRQHEPRRIARGRRAIEKSDESVRPRIRGLYFDGVWEPL